MGEYSLSIHKLFEKQVALNPDYIALKYLDQQLTYKELHERSNYLANYLQERGLQEGEFVAISLSHSIELIVSILAVLKCGAAYLPIDSSNPDKRLEFCLTEAKVRFLISTSSEQKTYYNNRTVITTEDSKLFNTPLSKFDSLNSDYNSCAYLMFTSGSTGQPKGALIPHRAVQRLVINTNYIDISPQDNVLQFAPPSFDASTFEIWGALLNGATLVLYSGQGMDPNLFKKDIINNDITILWLTAALFHFVADKFIEVLTSLRVLLAGGDVLNAKYVNKVLEKVSGIHLINGYGPTENTTFTCCHLMTSSNAPDASVPIGKAITGTQIHVLDEMLKPVETGHIGELFTSGAGVALGYLDNSNREDSFFFNPTIASGLIYKTGDLVRENNNGELEFIGRSDNQVKVRGYRVSLEEVKTSIVELEDVSDAAVLVKKFDSGDQLLVAYIQIHEGQELSVKLIKNKLANSLPDYMIPDQFIFNENLPINKNGKIDRNRLNIL